MLNNLKKLFVLTIAIQMLFVFTGCHNYYKASVVNVNRPAKAVDSLQQQNRFFILRSGSNSYYMNNIKLSDDRTALDCTLDSLPPEHRLHLNKGRNGNMRYKKSDINDLSVLNEVHFYINAAESTSFGKYTLQLEKVQKIEVIEKDKKRTANSYVIGALGYTVGAFVVAAVIVAATKSSCPFVSAYTNNEFVLQGEIFGGAIYPQLARDDYMPLRMQPTENGTLQLKISNELQERQYTDFADLMVVTHAKNTRVLSDEKGNLYEVAHPQSPIAAWTGNHKDAMALLLQKDDNTILHFDDTLATNANNFVITEFNKPSAAKQAKLILSIKNSYWLDYLYGEMAKGFGSYYNTYVRKQNKTPASALLQWAKDQQLPLTVSVERNSRWDKVAEITTIGPLATREIVVAVDVSGITGNSMKIKLSSGFMFWEIDYAAIDFSTDKNFKIETITPSTATDETGKNVLPQLIKKDGNYLEQPVPGNSVTLEYLCKPQDPNTARSYFLHTHGYYTHVRDLKGSPRIAFLKQFKKPGGLPLYSLGLYKKFRTTTMQSLVKN